MLGNNVIRFINTDENFQNFLKKIKPHTILNAILSIQCYTANFINDFSIFSTLDRIVNRILYFNSPENSLLSEYRKLSNYIAYPDFEILWEGRSDFYHAAFPFVPSDTILDLYQRLQSTYQGINFDEFCEFIEKAVLNRITSFLKGRNLSPKEKNDPCYQFCISVLERNNFSDPGYRIKIDKIPEVQNDFEKNFRVMRDLTETDTEENEFEEINLLSSDEEEETEFEEIHLLSSDEDEKVEKEKKLPEKKELSSKNKNIISELINAVTKSRMATTNERIAVAHIQSFFENLPEAEKNFLADLKTDYTSLSFSQLLNEYKGNEQTNSHFTRFMLRQFLRAKLMQTSSNLFLSGNIEQGNNYTLGPRDEHVKRRKII